MAGRLPPNQQQPPHGRGSGSPQRPPSGGRITPGASGYAASTAFQETESGSVAFRTDESAIARNIITTVTYDSVFEHVTKEYELLSEWRHQEEGELIIRMPSPQDVLSHPTQVPMLEWGAHSGSQYPKHQNKQSPEILRFFKL